MRSLIVDLFQREEESLLLKDIIQLRFWNLGGLYFVLPSTLSQKIKVTHFPLAATSVDHISWASSPNGDFDLKEAYNLACMANGTPHYDLFTSIWV